MAPESRLEKLLHCRYPAIAIYRTEAPPEGCGPVGEGHCCIQCMLVPVISERRSVCASRRDLRCAGSWSGLGLGDEKDFDMIADAYSNGRDGRPGRRFFDCPDRVRADFVAAMPPRGKETDLVVMEPLERTLERGTEPEVVAFLVDPVRISALMTLAGFDRGSPDPPVLMRFGYSCQQIFLLPLIEGEGEDPRGVVGLTELFTRRFIDPDLMSFSIPWNLYRRMESNAERSFLTDESWRRASGNCC